MLYTRKYCSTLATVTLFGCMLSACVSTNVAQQSERATANKVPKNIVMVIADGMGPAYTTGYRFYADNPATDALEETIFDQILVGSARTNPHSSSGRVTDSAASATALATGIKSYNGAIGVDVNKQPLETVLHRAHKLGMQTGLAVTSHIVHATPASYMVANEQRKNYSQIADSFFDDRLNGRHLADIMLGAGWPFFIRSDRNLVDEFKADGYQYIDSYTQLDSVGPNQPVLGLFGDSGLPWALDDQDPTRLASLSKVALEFLHKRSAKKNDQGYFLLIEASQVDWAGHANDIASAMAEMHDLDLTMQYLFNYVQQHPDTLVVLTADHSTGGLTLGADGDYRWDPVFLQNFNKSINTIAAQMGEQEDQAAFVEQMFGFDLTTQERERINGLSRKLSPTLRESVLKKIVDKRTNTGWTTNGHTAVDVGVYAFGAGAELFRGNLDNTDIAKKLFGLLDKHENANR